MRSVFASLALAALATALPQGVTESISPSTTASGCSPDYSGTFNIETVNITTNAKRDLSERQTSGLLTLTLQGGILKDQAGRTGYIAANRQFQFDAPPQTGAIYTAGWSVCPNNSLAIGGDSTFKNCLSGTFYNIYDENDAAQCQSITIQVLGSGSSQAQSPASVQADGQPTANPVSQIADGQAQAVTQLADGQPQAPTGAPVSQIADGQPQAATGAPVTQIADGQPQAPTASPVTQIGDGQIQAPTGAAVSQISDGQVQAPTNGTGVSTPSATVQPFTGAASAVRGDLFALVAAGFMAVLAL